MYLWTAPEGSYTVEEFKRLPLEGRRWELLDGAVDRMEDHGFKTSIFTGSVLSDLHDHVEELKSGVILGPGCGFQLWPGSETVRVTDISFTRADRLPPKHLWNDFPRAAPDLIVEIFSPFEQFDTAMDRITMFLEAGAREAWFIDPAKQSVTVFRPVGPPKILSESDTLDGSNVLPEFTIGVAELFSEDNGLAMAEPQRASVEEFESMPLDGSWELIDGEMFESALAVEASSSVSATIVALLGQFVRTHRLGRVYSAGGFDLFPGRATVRVPDIAFVSADRVPQGESRKHFPYLAPDLAVEVLSPIVRKGDALAKVAMYLQAGVHLVWLVDPFALAITVFRQDGAIQSLREDDALDGGDALPGLTIPLAEIFEPFA